MPKRRISTDLTDGTWFLTLTTQRWYYLFDRHRRWENLADSLRYCQEHKGLEINGYVFMLNHLHLIVTSHDAAGFTRDIKRHTSRMLRRNLVETEPRVLELFIDEGGQYRFWQEGAGAKRVESPAFYRQKLGYIHTNPVRKQYVTRPECWYWSSANPESPIEVAIFGA